MWTSGSENLSVQLDSLFDELLSTLCASLADLFTEGTEYLMAEPSHPASSALSASPGLPESLSFPSIEGTKSAWFYDW